VSSFAIVRVGQGWDLHRLEAGGPLRLGGVDVPFDRRARGHSDGDVVLHALTDAVLGAVGAADIGTHFPDTDPQLRGADSAHFLRHALGIAAQRGFRVANADVTVIAERPRLAPHRDAILARLAELLDVPADAVSLKAKTAEGLGAVGAGEAIAALCSVGMTTVAPTSP
jgi:2-C-methyl-D-erythritol 2,4-cyclodiphosphate synthase